MSNHENSSSPRSSLIPQPHTPVPGLYFPLAMVPSELWSEIEAYLPVFDLANLWCCGCLLLHHKMSSARGIRQISLLDRWCTLLDWFPRFIFGLKGIESISMILSADNASWALPPTLAELNTLPTSLKEINFRFQQAASIWGPVLVDWPILPFNTRFPSLNTLNLSNQSSECNDEPIEEQRRTADTLSQILPVLPSSLTKFCFDFQFPTNPRLHDFSILPSCLEELTLGLGGILDIDFIFALPNLRCLRLPNVTEISYRDEGSSMVYLTILEVPKLRTILHFVLGVPTSVSDASEAFFRNLPSLTHYQGMWFVHPELWADFEFWPKIRFWSVWCPFDPFDDPQIDSSRALPPKVGSLELSNVQSEREFIEEVSKFSALHTLVLPDRQFLVLSDLSLLPPTLTLLTAHWDSHLEPALLLAIPSNLKHLRHSAHPWHFRNRRRFLTSSLPHTLDSFTEPGIYLFNTRLAPHLLTSESSWASMSELITYGDPKPVVAMSKVDSQFEAHVYSEMVFLIALQMNAKEILELFVSREPTAILALKQLEKDSQRNWMLESVASQGLGSLDWLKAHHFRFPNNLDENPLLIALSSDNIPILEWLFKYGFNCDESTPQHSHSPITMAILNNLQKSLVWLLERGFRRINWPIVLKAVLVTDSLFYLEQLEPYNIQVPSDLFLELLSQLSLVSTVPSQLTPIIQWLWDHGMDSHTQISLHGENLTQMCFAKFFATDSAIYDDQQLIDLCVWLHKYDFDISLPFKGPFPDQSLTIRDIAQNIKMEQQLISFLDSIKN